MSENPLGEERMAAIVTVRERRIVRTVVHPSPEQALKTVGLKE
jgi:hypothetical protein